MRLPKIKKPGSGSTPSEGPNYKKRLLDSSKLLLGAVVRRYWRDYDGVLHHDDYEITRNGSFEAHGTMWTSGRPASGGRQEYLALADMGIIPLGNGAYNRAYTILLKPGRQK